MIRKLWNTLCGKRLYEDIDDGLQFHLASKWSSWLRREKTPEEARRLVQFRFGNKLCVKERTAC